MNYDPIYVTKPFLPPLSEMLPYFESIWQSRILSNSGPHHQCLEENLEKFLGVPEISLFGNGTLALLIALKSLRLSGEVITTPYTFVATANSICWNNLTPVFADIDPDTFNLDPVSVEKKITPNTCAILPVHCYGIPCDVSMFSQLGDNYNLPVVYDASHAFGVRMSGESILNYGDLSTLSFHATKVFNTFEGGAVVSGSAAKKRKIDRLKNFGFVDETTVAVNGINAKMSEICAVIGLAQINHVERCLQARHKVARIYARELSIVSQLLLPHYNETFEANYAYYPVRVLEDIACSKTRDGLVSWLRSEYSIYARRYFYPLVSQFPYFRGFCSDDSDIKNSLIAASQVVCLPIYPDMTESDLSRVINAIKEYFCV